MERRLLLLTVLGTLAVQAYATHFFYLPIALGRIGFSPAAAGLLLSIFPLATTIARPAGSFLTERWGVRRSFLFAAVLLALFSLPMATSRSFENLFLLRLMTGAAYGLCMVALTAFQAMGIPEVGRGSAFSWIAAGYVLPQLLLLPLLDVIFALGFTAPFFWIIPLLAAGCALVAWITPDLPKKLVEGGKAWGTWAEVSGTPQLASLLVSWVLFALANSAGLQFIPAFLSERGMIPSVFIISLATTSLVVRLAANRLMDRLPRKRLTGVSIGLIGLGTLLSLGCRSNVSLVAVGVLYGLGMGIGFPTLLALVPDVFPFMLRTKGVAVSFFAMDLGWIVSPLLVGCLGELGGLRVALATTGFLGLAGGVALQIWGWKARSPGSGVPL